MKLSEFKARVKALAGGKYHFVRIVIHEHSDGELAYEWSAYIDGVGIKTARKPKDVLMGIEGWPMDEKPDDEELPE